MKYVIIGSSGGLGSFLYQELRTPSSSTIGVDICPSQTVDILLQPNFDHLLSDIQRFLNTSYDPVTFIFSVAQPDRLRSFTRPSDLALELETILVRPINLLLFIATFLQDYCPNARNLCHLITIGSVLSDRFSRAETPLYGASKAAIRSLVRDLSISLMNYNVCVNTISPALLFRDQSSKNNLLKQLSTTGLPFRPTPYVDIANTIKFLTHGNLSSLRGQNIVLDYGLEHMESFDLLRNLS